MHWARTPPSRAGRGASGRTEQPEPWARLCHARMLSRIPLHSLQNRFRGARTCQTSHLIVRSTKPACPSNEPLALQEIRQFVEQISWCRRLAQKRRHCRRNASTWWNCVNSLGGKNPTGMIGIQFVDQSLAKFNKCGRLAQSALHTPPSTTCADPPPCRCRFSPSWDREIGRWK